MSRTTRCENHHHFPDFGLPLACFLANFCVDGDGCFELVHGFFFIANLVEELTGDLAGLRQPCQEKITGVMILYADDEAFTVMIPEGHPESGFNTFSAYEADGVVVAQIQSLARANDPVYEFGFRFLGGSKKQEKIWQHVLTQLARQFGVTGQIEMDKTV